MNLPPLSCIDVEALDRALEPRPHGFVEDVVGLLIEGQCPGAAVGDLVSIAGGGRQIPAEVVGLRRGRVLLVALGDVRGVSSGSRITHLGVAASVACGEGLLGRVVDGRGEPIDDGGRPLQGARTLRPIYADPPGPLERRIIDQPLSVGIRVLDGLLTFGRGQRVGIMAGAGVGKSTLMGQIAQHATAQVNVIALIGERGREVGEFLHHTLSPEALARTVVVAATSDQSPLERMRGAFVATAIAEHFAAAGRDVLLMMDSLTRFSMAQRELGLSMGEPPATRGYTPSVFAQLPRLLERAGQFGAQGSITGIYTVLVEGDDMNDPIGDAARSILDGHIVLSRDLAARGHYPAVDALPSISRVMSAVVDERHQALARAFRARLAKIREAEELAQIGAYVPGADAELDRALQSREHVNAFLRQGPGSPSTIEQTVTLMAQVLEGAP